MADLLEGVVQFFNIVKAFGFIATDERSYFVHQRHVLNGFVLRSGDRVQFRPGPSISHPNKMQAYDVELVERATQVVRQ